MMVRAQMVKCLVFHFGGVFVLRIEASLSWSHPMPVRHQVNYSFLEKSRKTEKDMKKTDEKTFLSLIFTFPLNKLHFANPRPFISNSLGPGAVPGLLRGLGIFGAQLGIASRQPLGPGPRHTGRGRCTLSNDS